MIKDDHDENTEAVITVLGHFNDQYEDMNMIFPFRPRVVNNGDGWLNVS